MNPTKRLRILLQWHVNQAETDTIYKDKANEYLCSESMGASSATL